MRSKHHLSSLNFLGWHQDHITHHSLRRGTSYAGVGLKTGHAFGGLSTANIIIFLCKAAEVLSMHEATATEKLKFLAVTGLAQYLGLWIFMMFILAAWMGLA